jgi:hypothetical protein
MVLLAFLEYGSQVCDRQQIPHLLLLVALIADLSVNESRSREGRLRRDGQEVAGGVALAAEDAGCPIADWY